VIQLLSLLWVFLVGCTPEPECAVHADCEQGLACLYESPADELPSCIEPQCWTSDQCRFNSYCEPETLECLDGCRNDRDCFAGEVCDDGECGLPECDNAHRDCEVGDDCRNGVCTEDPNVCQSCGTSCGAGYDCYGGYCLRNCVEQEDCPAGFSCVDTDAGEWVCYNDCSWLKRHGYP
jgi:hypothetical protein